MKLKKIFIIYLLLPIVAGVYAVPAKRDVFRNFLQPNGEEVVLMLKGNEKFHYWSTTDDIPVVESNDGYCYYVQAIEGIKLIPGKRIAKDPEKRSPGETELLDQINSGLQKSIRKTALLSSTGLNDGKVPTTGTLKGLVILAQFSDREFTDICTKEQMERQLNESGYSDFGMTGSARDFFIDQSNGLFTPTFDVVGPVTVSRDMAYYGQDNNNAYDIRLNQFIKEACELADQEGINFADYDNNEDGEADLVFVIYAGYAQSSGAPSYTIWPQMWFLEKLGTDLTLDDVKINTFACANELYGMSGKSLAGIGPFCHEFSHTLGLADIYNYNSKLSMGSWNIMDNGLYNNNSCTPAGYSSFEKMSLGWIEPVELTEAGTDIELKPLGVSTEAYKLTSPNNENEFFLLENRQMSSKWDQYIGGSGMLVLHVNYDEDVWNENDVNTDPNNMRMHIIPANGNYSSGSSPTSVPFPGSSRKTTFTSISTPSSVFSDGYVLDKPVTGIREEGENIFFDFMQRLKAPVALEATNLVENSFTANWEKGEGALKYIVSLVNTGSGEEKIISNITRTRFTFDNLESGGSYAYKVKSIGEELSSSYSDEITVNLGASVINELESNDFSFFYQNETLFVNSGSAVQVFNLYGEELYNITAERAASGVILAPGIYIVRTGKTVKKIALH